MRFLISIVMVLLILTISAVPAHCRINIIGTWGGVELDNFLKVCEASSVEVSFETTRDLDAIIETRAGGGNLPDAAIIPNPSKVRDLAKRGIIKPLSFLNKEEMINKYSKKWTDMGCFAGKIYCVFYKVTNKSLIWYNPGQFSALGLKAPVNWNELVALSDKISSKGTPAWSIGADIGWPLTDWIENIIAKNYGGEFYQSWVDHDIAWTHADIKNAFRIWGQIVDKDENLYGKRSGSLAETFQKASFAVFKQPPEAMMYCGADFMGGIISEGVSGLKPGINISFFAFPAAAESKTSPIVVGADAIVLFRQGAEAEKLVKFLTSAQAHKIWAGRGGFISHNKDVDLNVYPDELSKKSARMVCESDDIVFDASDMMPPAVGNRGGFWDACKRYLKNPQDLDKILEDMEKLAKQHY